MRDYIYNACEEIDAAVYSGDAFSDAIDRDGLRDYMARWERGLKEFEEPAAGQGEASNSSDGKNEKVSLPFGEHNTDSQKCLCKRAINQPLGLIIYQVNMDCPEHGEYMRV